jgi:hypothetical protein
MGAEKMEEERERGRRTREKRDKIRGRGSGHDIPFEGITPIICFLQLGSTSYSFHQFPIISSDGN